MKSYQCMLLPSIATMQIKYHYTLRLLMMRKKVESKK